MSEDTNKEKRNCTNKKGAMLAYGVIQLGTSVASALALSLIAFSFCSVKEESKLFTECVEELQENGKSSSQAVHFCNGGR